MLPVVNFVKWNFFWSTGLFLDSIVTSRLDYCNALLSGAPAATFDKLQRAQNNMSRVACHSRSHTDARPLLHTLHWLPVRQQVTYKLAVLTHKVRTTATPTYLGELVQTHAPLRGLRALRSSDAPTRRSSHTHGTGPSRFFCCCSIHLDVTLCENILTFKRHLKTHLFS